MNREALEGMLKDFGHMLSSETVIGDPITIGKVTIVPVVSVSFAFGSGGGSGESDRERPAGANATTAGARLTPVAFLSVHEDGSVNLHHVKAKEANIMDRLLEMAPGFIDKIGSFTGFTVKDTSSADADDLLEHIDIADFMEKPEEDSEEAPE